VDRSWVSEPSSVPAVFDDPGTAALRDIRSTAQDASRVDGTAIDVRLLGPVEAAEAERLLPLGGRRQRALLALLALEVGRAVSADALAEELWSGRPPAGAATTLRSYASRLRRALGPDVVRARGGGYVLEIPPERIDVRRFERALREGREALGRGAAGAAAERLRVGLSLWRGPALADVTDTGSLAAEAQRLDELRLVGREDLFEADLALGRHTEVVADLERLVEEEPFRERLWRLLVLALFRSDRQADALEAYRRAAHILREEHGLDPGDELVALQQAILRHEVEPVRVEEPPHNLPARLTSFVGRERELDELGHAIRGHRLVTLTGVGGSGKTRLALEAAEAQLGAWTGGVWLVELAPLTDPDLVAAVIARSLGVAERPDAPIAVPLRDHLRAAELLLVLDNCEHVVDACSDQVASLLTGCPDLHVLATSRVPLAIAGELEVEVDPLEVPAGAASVDEVERSPAVRLFVDRARLTEGVDDPPASLETAARICRELDGLPLAIELAAARTKVLSLDEIAERLGDRFQLLRSWRRVADPRHRTLEATIDWSLDLLDPSLRDAFARLGVFAGSFTPDAARVVCDVDLDALTELVDHSLVRRWTDDRLSMLQTIRTYARERLDELGGSEELGRRHVDFLLTLADRSAQEGFEGEEIWLHRIEEERDNIRGALDGSLTTDPVAALRLAAVLGRFWIIRDNAEGYRWLSAALARAHGAEPALRADGLRWAGSTLYFLRDVEGALALFGEALAIFRELDDVQNTAWMLDRMAAPLLRLGRLDDARAFAEESLALFRDIGDRRGTLYPMQKLGWVAWESGDRAEGEALIEESLSLAREFGDRWWETEQLASLAEMSLAEGYLDRAAELCRESLELGTAIGARIYVVFCVALLAGIAAREGDAERAGRLWGGVMALQRGGDPPLDPIFPQELADAAASDTGSVEAGLRMGPDAVIDYALRV
jgi:predicted ATPase/DNA-binding SARP family transcriptional activator